ncbi:MAG: hypothetical protein ABI559_13260 [Chloroflexota bacterium]
MATITKELRFALDEKGMKEFGPTLIGKVISYWDNDRQLKHGKVMEAVMLRDRYGNPFIEVQLEPAASGSDHGVVVPATGAVGE